MKSSLEIRGSSELKSAAPQCVGFTVIEFLILIVIGGILLALLVPVFEKTSEEANRAQCRDNIRLQLAGMHLFAEEHYGVTRHQVL